VSGIGYGCSTVIYNRRFLAAFGRRGPSMLALLNAIFGIGAIGAPLLFVALGSDPAVAYGLVAALAVATFAVAGRDAPVAAAGAATRPFRLSPATLCFGALAIGTEACLIGLGPTGLIARGVSEAGAAGMLSAFFTAFLAARLALVPLAGDVAPFALLAGALAATGGMAAAVALGGPAWLFVPMGATAALFFPAFYMTGVARMGDHPRVSPVLVAAGLAGGILMPLIFGAVMEATGTAALFALVAAVALAGAGAAATLLRAMARPAAA
jgi:hypothetical protein